MTIHERMVARTEREKDLLKYGRSQERERIIKLLEAEAKDIVDDRMYGIETINLQFAIALIKGEK